MCLLSRTIADINSICQFFGGLANVHASLCAKSLGDAFGSLMVMGGGEDRESTNEWTVSKPQMQQISIGKKQSLRN